MIDREQILHDWMKLETLSDQSDSTDDRSECERKEYNTRHLEAVFSFTDSLYRGHLATARAIAHDNDWERDMVSDLLNWWLMVG